MTPRQEYDLNKIELSNQRLQIKIGFARFIIGGFLLLGAIFLIFWGIRPMLGQEASSLEAIASIVKAFNFSNITGYLVGTGGVVLWGFERSGKKRAIQEKGYYQKICEENEPNRTSSGLNERGETPR